MTTPLKTIINQPMSGDRQGAEVNASLRQDVFSYTRKDLALILRGITAAELAVIDTYKYCI